MNAAARLTLAEAAIARLAIARGPKVSDELKLARARARQGEAAPILHDVGELEVAARLPGIAGRMARGRLRAILGVPPDALLPVPPAPQDALGEVGTGNPASDVPPRPTAPMRAAAGTSVSELTARIDQLLLGDG